jgi:hypothetical protein
VNKQFFFAIVSVRKFNAPVVAVHTGPAIEGYSACADVSSPNYVVESSDRSEGVGIITVLPKILW